MKRLALPLVLAAAGTIGCQPPPGPLVTRPAPLQGVLLGDLVGGWRWRLATSEAGTTRIESESWRFRPALGAPTQLTGRYLRDVEVRSDDGAPFGCNQRPWYRQRAIYDVTVESAPAGLAIREIGYRTEPSPCDHGFRRLASYTASRTGDRLVVRWDGGAQTLSRTDGELAELPLPPWPSAPELAGAWRWDSTSRDRTGDLRDETERWEIVRRSDSQLDASYRRVVTVRSADGSLIPCAGAPSWSFEDAYLLDGQREDEHWRLREVAADPATHPCLAATPQRNLDEATAEQIGDYLVLEWRGKRRQVLYRAPGSSAAGDGPGDGGSP